MRKPEVARELFPPPALDGPTLQRGPAARWLAYWGARRLILQIQHYPADVLRGLADEMSRQKLSPSEVMDRLCRAAEQESQA